MSAAVAELIRDECATCEGCGAGVSARERGGKNLPCGCIARVSFCHCDCIVDAGEADLFEALVEPRSLEEIQADRLIRMSQEWRPSRVAWILFAVAVTLVIAGMQTLDLIK